MSGLVSIDPGSSGAYAVFAGGSITVSDLPVMNGQIDMIDLAHRLRFIDPERIVMERVSSMPKQGVASTFKFGVAYGIIQGVVGALGCPWELVPATVWKGALKLKGADKEGSRELARRLYPAVPGLELKKHHDRAEALLIGHWWFATNPLSTLAPRGIALWTAGNPEDPE